MIDAKGAVPESWACLDCGINTAPGCSTREQIEQAFAVIRTNNESVTQRFDDQTEVYMVKPTIWKAAGMDDFGGCLCIGCLEKRIGRTLMPRDFMRNHAFSGLPGTERLLARRDGVRSAWNPNRSP
jgi:hypothetical protein